MTIYQRLQAVFTAADVTAFLQEWRPTEPGDGLPPTYCAYCVRAESEALACDDMELIRAYDVWIDLYAKADPEATVQLILAALKENRFFVRLNQSYTPGRQTRYEYHRGLRVTYYDDFSAEEPDNND